MADRCKLGDVAIIIKDQPGCEVNIGRVVQVCAPRRVFPGRGTVWHIKPVNGTTITFLDDASNSIKRGKANGIEHEDDWLLPIRPGPVQEATTVVSEVPTPETMETA
jgi:hypothetical protein